MVNPEGLRYPDEFVRHKVLDAIGDLALAGAPIVGKFRSCRGGHRMNFLALEALFADRAAYAFVEAPATRPGSLCFRPRAGVDDGGSLCTPPTGAEGHGRAAGREKAALNFHWLVPTRAGGALASGALRRHKVGALSNRW